MTAFNGYPLSIVLAVFIHGSVLASLFFFQRANTEVIEVIRPPSVKATLVGENPQARNQQIQQERQRQERRQEEQRVVQRREEEERQQSVREEELRTREAERERTAQLERQQQAEQRQAEEQQREREEQEKRQQELAVEAADKERQRQEQAQQAQRDAEAQQQAAMEGEAVMSYTSMIHDLVQEQWSRPPSARNGMVAVLNITLAPTGDILDVVIAQTSGDFAFDRAAESAVLKVGRFTELQGMDYSLFERNFRRFRLTFRPEDLLN